MNTLLIGAVSGALGVGALVGSGFYLYDKGGDNREKEIEAEIREENERVYQEQINMRDEQLEDERERADLYRRESLRLQGQLDAREDDISRQINNSIEGLRDEVLSGYAGCPNLGDRFISLYNSAAGFPGGVDGSTPSSGNTSTGSSTVSEKMPGPFTYNE